MDSPTVAKRNPALCAYHNVIVREMDALREAHARKGRLNVIPRDFDPRWVEGSMRLQYGTLDHLDGATFRAEIMLAIECERAEPGFGESIALSYGIGLPFGGAK